MFHLDDLEPSVRRKYGDITDREYYDFWASTGSQAYQQSSRSSPRYGTSTA